MRAIREITKKYYVKEATIYLLVYLLVFGLPIRVAVATPTNPDVVKGVAGVTQTGNNTTVTMNSKKAVINWDGLNTSSNEVLQFVKASGHFTVLNRVSKGGATQFDGSLFGNQGHIIIVNPKGIVFGTTAIVDAYKFTASALDIKNEDFMNGIYKFAGGDGPVANYGKISAEQVALIGKKVLNAGLISSPGGYVLMAAGERVFLGQEGSNVVVEVASVTPGAATEGLGNVVNEGTVEAAGGNIVLAAGDTFSRAIEGLDTLALSVNGGTGRVVQSGTLNADSATGNGGSVTLTAADEVVLNDGSLTSANAGDNGDGGQVIVYSPGKAVFDNGAQIQAKGGSQSGDGGFAEISGKQQFVLAGDLDLSAENGAAGSLLLDPLNLTIADGARPGTPALDTVYEEDVEGFSVAGIDVRYEADKNITVEDIADNEIKGGSGDITFLTRTALDSSIRFEDYKNDVISTTTGDITMVAGTGGIDIGSLITGSFNQTASPGRIRLLTIGGDVVGGGDIETGPLMAQGGSNALVSVVSSGDIRLHGDADNPAAMASTNLDNPAAVGNAQVCLQAAGDIEITGSVFAGAAGASATNAGVHICADGSVDIDVLADGQVIAEADTGSPAGTANASIMVHAGPGHSVSYSGDGGFPFLAVAGVGEDPPTLAIAGFSPSDTDVTVDGAHALIDIQDDFTGICPDCPTPPTITSTLTFTDTYTNTETETVSTTTQIETTTLIETPTQIETTTQTETPTQIETSTMIETVTQTEIPTQIETTTIIDTVTQTEIPTQIETTTMIDTVTQTEIPTQIETTTMIETTTQTETPTQIETTTIIDTVTQTDIPTQIETTTMIDTVTQIEIPTQIETTTMIETTTQTETPTQIETTTLIQTTTETTTQIEITLTQEVTQTETIIKVGTDTETFTLIDTSTIADTSTMTDVAPLTLVIKNGDGDSDMANSVFYEKDIEAMSNAGTSMTFHAWNGITFNDILDGAITGGSGNMTFVTLSIDGFISFDDKTNTISTTTGNIAFIAGSGVSNGGIGINIGNLQTGVDRQPKASMINIVTVNGGNINTGYVHSEGGDNAFIGVISDGDLTINGSVMSTTNQVPEADFGKAIVCLMASGNINVNGAVTVEVHGKNATVGDVRICAGENATVTGAIDSRADTSKNTSGSTALATIEVHAGWNKPGAGTISLNGTHAKARISGYGAWQEVTGSGSGNQNLSETNGKATAHIEINNNVAEPCPGCATASTETLTHTGTATYTDTEIVPTITDTVIETTTIIDTVTQTEIPTEIETTTMIDSTTQTETPTQIETTTMIDSTTQTETPTQIETTTMIDSTTQTETPTQIETTTMIDTTTQTEIPTEIETTTMIDTTTQTETPTQIETTTMIETTTQTETPTQIETTTMIETTTQTETPTQIETTTLIDTVTQTEIRTQIETTTQIEVGTLIETDTVIKREIEVTITETKTETLIDLMTEIVPAAPLPLQVEVELSGCPVLLEAASNELGVSKDTIQISIQNALAVNPNIQPCDTCAKLVNAVAALQDPDGSKMAALAAVINQIAPADVPFTPEMGTMIATAFAENAMAEGSNYAVAAEYLDAFVNYVAALDTMGSPVGDSTTFVMAKYGTGVSENANPNIAAYVAIRLAAKGG